MRLNGPRTRITDTAIVMARRAWREGWLTVPGISFALLPKLACPLCWPFYAGIVSSLGLGFLISTTYLLPLTIAFLILALGALAYNAKRRRGYGPFVFGIVGAAAVLVGKFNLESNGLTFTGIAILVMASAWNMRPLPVVKSCSCDMRSGDDGEVSSARGSADGATQLNTPRIAASK